MSPNFNVENGVALAVQIWAFSSRRCARPDSGRACNIETGGPGAISGDGGHERRRGLPKPPRTALSARSGHGPLQARAAVGEQSCGPQCLTSIPSALPVPYQCLTSALPSALPREPYEFTRWARPIFQINSPALPEEENSFVYRKRPACKFIGSAR